MKFRLLIFFFITGFILSAQTKMTIENAISIALKNNYDILVAGNEADIAKTNNTLGNAGILPTAEIIGSGSYELNTVNQTLQNGTQNNYNSVSSTSLNGGAQLSWTLFDGGKMFVRKNKLKEIQLLGELQFKDQVQYTMYEIIAAFYNIVKQKQQLISINEVINFNKERVKIAEIGFNSGSLLKSDFLSAKIDLNVLLESAINQQFEINASKKSLNILLAKQPDTEFEVEDSIPLIYHPDKNELMNKLFISNTEIQSLEKKIDVSRLEIKENKLTYLPTINFTGGYYFSQNNNSQGTYLKNNSSGPQVGGTLAIPLYSAGENQRKISISKIQLTANENDLQLTKLQLAADLENNIKNFENQQKLLEIEKENNQLAKENLNISLQRLRLGQATSLEVRLAQTDYVQSSTRLINFQYNLKIAESKLKQLIAEL
ncbi:MAG: TolC family protein [Paludibacter sp.]|nr:TolC family protein [Paludibacter sp.]